MPLSDFGLSQHSQVFPVFGTKRKHEWDELEQGHPNMFQESAAKRLCSAPADEGDAMNKMLEINHNSIPPNSTHGVQCNVTKSVIHHNTEVQRYQQQIQEQYQQQQQLHEQQQQQQQFELQKQLHQEQSQLEVSENHNTMVMDLCDETYSHAQLDQETQSMYSNMDSDCLPSLQQYGGGDRSPTSGRVRCYCKPSWEGLMEMRPYVSDYY